MNTAQRFAGRILPALLLALALACRGEKGTPTPQGDAGSGLGFAGPNATLFYAGAEGTGLAACPVIIPAEQGKKQSLEALVDRYLDGPACEGQVNPFPQGTSVRAAYILNGGVAVVDLTSQARSGGGTQAEEIRVYGLVDTIAFNHPDIVAVKILVEGREVDSLLGHLDLSRPLPPNTALLPTEARKVFGSAHGT